MGDSFCIHPSRAILSLAKSEQVRIVPLPKTTDEYMQVKILLSSGWRHRKKRKPRIIRVLKVLRSEKSYEPFHSYQKRLQIHAIMSPKGGVYDDATECLLFHGTLRACLLGEEENETSPCLLRNCRLCSIIRKSFDVNLCGSHHKFSRFGKAIYTTSCSSKADDYCSNSNAKAKRRVLLLNRVITGKEFNTKLNSSHLVRPPTGYNSVVGKPGVHLNYEETVVYNNDAIRPAYLVVYEPRPDVAHIISDSLKVIFRRSAK